MKLRMLALFAIFAVSAWLPYAAQQTSAHQAAPQSQAPPTSPAPHKDPANPTCACCDPALHGSTPAANLHAEACCHGHEVTSTTCCHHDNNDTKPARSCCHARNANACSSRDRTSCCASNGSPAAAAARGLAISGMTKLAVPPEPGSAPSPLTENNFHKRGGAPSDATGPSLRICSSKLQAQHANQLFLEPLYLEFPRMLFPGSVVQRLL